VLAGYSMRAALLLKAKKVSYEGEAASGLKRGRSGVGIRISIVCAALTSAV